MSKLKRLAPLHIGKNVSVWTERYTTCMENKVANLGLRTEDRSTNVVVHTNAEVEKKLGNI